MSLRAHVNRVAELTLNVSDLERSIAFYEALTPLRVHRRTAAGPQPFPAFGLDRGQFVGALLGDGTSSVPGVLVHLVHWLDPTPTGAAYPSFFHRGLYRMCFLTNEIDRRYERAVALGHPPFQPPHGHGTPVPGGSEGRSFVCPDPDGIAVQTTMRPSPWRDDLPDQLYHVNVVSSDVDGGRRFLRDVLGLDYVKRLTLPAPVSPIGFGLGSDVGQFDAAFLRHRGDHRFSIDIVNWSVPGVVGQPYASPFDLGIQRLAVEVDDLDAAAAALREQVDDALQGDVSGPETWYLDGGVERRVVHLRAPDGIAYELVEQTGYPGARETPWPPAAFDPPATALNDPVTDSTSKEGSTMREGGQ